VDPSTLLAQLKDDLRGHFRGDLQTDAASRAVYSTDASIFQLDPLAVAVPADEADLCTLVRWAHERSVPLVARGAGTGLAGESLGRGVVVDLSVHFRSVLEIGDDWVRVQPGVVLAELNARLAKVGRRFAPDPTSRSTCTIGGMIGTDASGRSAALHGTTGDHVRGLRLVWDNGSVAELPDGWARAGDSRTQEIKRGAAALLESKADLIALARPRARFDRCGYRLMERSAGSIDLTRLLVGSEGTLGIVTRATLATIPLAGGRGAVAIALPSLDAAIGIGLEARAAGAAACAVLDQRLVSWLRSRGSGLFPADAEAVLIVEFEATSPAYAADAVREFAGQVGGRTVVQATADENTIEGLWAACAGVATTGLTPAGWPRPVPFVEDIGIPPPGLAEFVSRARLVLSRCEISATLWIDPGMGHVDLRPFADPDDPAGASRFWALADELHGLAIDLGGTVSARHGTGIARTPWVERQYGPLYPVMRELKAVFDPRGILNPGKVVGPDPGQPAWPLRVAPVSTPVADTGPSVSKVAEPARSYAPLLVWQSDELARAAGACTGCGACRTRESGGRMCPIFRATGAEAAAPRAKANLFRAMTGGQLAGVAADDVRAVADLCVNCRMCAAECPEHVDVPKLMLEAKAANHEAYGFRRPGWFLARMDGLAAFGSRFAFTSNTLLGRRTVRWLLEKVFGLARQRTLPRFAFRPFLARARRRGLTKRPPGGPAVAYFVDTYANVFDPSVAEATVAVLKHNGIPVYVPHRQRGSGAFALAHGDMTVARERLLYNVRRLADAARAGDTIVCSEPTAALFFRVDGPSLFDDPDVRLVASRTVELTSYLWSLHKQGRLRTDFHTIPMAVGHHVPCHVKALGQGEWGSDLLSLIPGLTASRIDVSCSGMAGTYGLNVHNLPISLEAGRPMLDELARPRHTYGSSECSACRLQMQQGTGKRAVHPVQYLALAYGLMPSVSDRLRRPFGGRVSE
jgi:FAD/FMN-containing dehydrogenase/Fe-S oxidoreductase